MEMNAETYCIQPASTTNIIRNIEMDIGVPKKTSNGKYQVEFFDREKKTLE